jgi:SAM-dependent methyltransferase
MSTGLPALRGFARRRAVCLAARLRPSVAMKLLEWWLAGVTVGEPRQAMRRLLEVDERLWTYIDTVALRYDVDGPHVKHRLMRYHDFFLSRLAPGEQVLDVGCGNGAVAYDMATEAGALVTAIDVNEAQIAVARSRYHCDGLEFIVGDATTGIPRRRYDTVVLSNVLEHIENRQAFLRSMMENAGMRRLLIRVPMWDRHWAVPLREELGLRAYGDAGHFIEYTASAFRAEMSTAGLEIVSLTVCWGEIWAEVQPMKASWAACGRANRGHGSLSEVADEDGGARL